MPSLTFIFDREMGLTLVGDDGDIDVAEDVGDGPAGGGGAPAGNAGGAGAVVGAGLGELHGLDLAASRE